VCKDCITSLVKNRINFTPKNIPNAIHALFPKVIVSEIPAIAREDISDIFKLLKAGQWTPAVIMTGRVFECIVFDYYGDDFFVNDEEDEEPESIDNVISSFYPQLYRFDYTTGQIIWNDLESEEDEAEDKVPNTLGGRINKLRDYLPGDAADELVGIKNIRNQAAHGKARYTQEQAIEYVKRVLKVVALTYNGNR